MIFLTFLFVARKCFVVNSAILWKKVLESSRTHDFVLSSLEILSGQHKHLLGPFAAIPLAPHLPP